MKKLLAIFLTALVLSGTGCVFSRNAYVENAEFDLELPKPVGVRVRLGVFKNLSGSDRRVMMRRGDGQVVPLEYQRWRLSPELLFQRCVYGTFEVAADNAEEVSRLNAVIYRFEFDERDNKAHLAVDFMIPDFRAPVSAAPPAERDAGRPITVRADVAVPVKDSADLGAARAEAMSECARLAIEKLKLAMTDKRSGRK